MLIAVSGVVILGYIFIIAGLILVLLAVPALLRKAYGATTQSLGWGDIIGKIISEGGPAGVVAALGILLIIVGLTMIGVKLPDL